VVWLTNSARIPVYQERHLLRLGAEFDKVDELSSPVRVVWNTWVLLTMGGTQPNNQRNNTMTKTELQRWALRMNAASLSRATTAEEFEHYSKWLAVYLRNLGVSL
jgi:hypothetical protein